jgi:hypothetical protein
MAFVRLRRYREARDSFADGVVRFPDQPLFKLALARLLAAAPDDRIRDGRRAMAIVDELMKGPQSIELAETAAMGLAEVGRFDQAIDAQRSVLEAARTANLEPVVRRATENLQRYERREPSRRPFADDELPSKEICPPIWKSRGSRICVGRCHAVDAWPPEPNWLLRARTELAFSAL